MGLPLDSPIIEYVHHGNVVKVRACLKGKHRDHCLCHQCKHLNMEDRSKNCPDAQELYEFCVKTGKATPVFECGGFDEL